MSINTATQTKLYNQMSNSKGGCTIIEDQHISQILICSLQVIEPFGAHFGFWKAFLVDVAWIWKPFCEVFKGPIGDRNRKRQSYENE